jgi:hypothetical protein
MAEDVVPIASASATAMAASTLRQAPLSPACEGRDAPRMNFQSHRNAGPDDAGFPAIPPTICPRLAGSVNCRGLPCEPNNGGCGGTATGREAGRGGVARPAMCLPMCRFRVAIASQSDLGRSTVRFRDLKIQDLEIQDNNPEAACGVARWKRDRVFFSSRPGD